MIHRVAVLQGTVPNLTGKCPFPCPRRGRRRVGGQEVVDRERGKGGDAEDESHARTAPWAEAEFPEILLDIWGTDRNKKFP